MAAVKERCDMLYLEKGRHTLPRDCDLHSVYLQVALESDKKSPGDPIRSRNQREKEAKEPHDPNDRVLGLAAVHPLYIFLHCVPLVANTTIGKCLLCNIMWPEEWTSNMLPPHLNSACIINGTSISLITTLTPVV